MRIMHANTHTHTHTVPDLSVLSDQMIRLLAMQRLQHLFTESGRDDKPTPLEAAKLNLNGIKQPVQPAQPVSQHTKQVKCLPSAGEIM